MITNITNCPLCDYSGDDWTRSSDCPDCGYNVADEGEIPPLNDDDITEAIDDDYDDMDYDDGYYDDDLGDDD